MIVVVLLVCTWYIIYPFTLRCSVLNALMVMVIFPYTLIRRKCILLLVFEPTQRWIPLPLVQRNDCSIVVMLVVLTLLFLSYAHTCVLPLLYYLRQDELEKRLIMKIRESPALAKARAMHALMTDSDPIDKVM